MDTNIESLTGAGGPGGREDEDNNQYREVAWAALTTAKETASVGKEIVSAVRARRG
jgi:hypothetical protein